MISNEASNMVNGLVLAGGKSSRMGQDKGAIPWHGMEQRDHLAALLQKYCLETYISCREEQNIESAYPLLFDTIDGVGPIGAILTAFQKMPATAWLVVACDLPLLDAPTLQYLSDNRNKNAIATTFESPYDGLPEPLITIWEPAAYPYLLALLGEGCKCPRKALIKSDNANILKAPYPDALINTNTPEDAEKVKAILSKTQVNQ